MASTRQYDAERDDTFRQVRRQIAQIDATERQIDLFEDAILPRAEQTLQVSIVDYRTGRVDFLQVIDNYAELLAFQIQRARLEANLGPALASLERVVGCQLASLPQPAVSGGPPNVPPLPAATDENQEEQQP